MVEVRVINGDEFTSINHLFLSKLSCFCVLHFRLLIHEFFKVPGPFRVLGACLLLFLFDNNFVNCRQFSDVVKSYSVSTGLP